MILPDIGLAIVYRFLLLETKNQDELSLLGNERTLMRSVASFAEAMNDQIRDKILSISIPERGLYAEKYSPIQQNVTEVSVCY